MSQFTDQYNLKNIQYKDSSNYNARLQLYQKFKTNNFDLQKWFFDNFDAQANAKIIELGCGTGLLWKKNIKRVKEIIDSKGFIRITPKIGLFIAKK